MIFDKVKSLSLTTTILDGIASFISLVVGFSCYFSLNHLEDAFNIINGYINSVDANSPSAGYEVIGGLFGVLVDGLFYAMLWMIVIVMIIVFVWCLIPTILGIVSRKKSKQVRLIGYEKFYSFAFWESVVKIALNGIFSLFLIVVMLMDGYNGFYFIVSIYFGLITGFSVWQLILVNKVHQEDIQYDC